MQESELEIHAQIFSNVPGTSMLYTVQASQAQLRAAAVYNII